MKQLATAFPEQVDIQGTSTGLHVAATFSKVYFDAPMLEKIKMSDFSWAIRFLDVIIKAKRNVAVIKGIDVYRIPVENKGADN